MMSDANRSIAPRRISLGYGEEVMSADSTSLRLLSRIHLLFCVSVPALIGVLALGCGREPREVAREALVHPDPRYIVRPQVPETVVRVSDLAAHRAATTLVVPSSTVLRDTAGRPIDLSPGRLARVVIGRRGLIHLLDDRLGNVQVFNEDGRLVETLGRLGSGPGEFSTPLTLATDNGGRLYVGSLDGSVQVFAPTGGRHGFERTIKLDVAPRAMCFLGDTVFVNGPKLDSEHVLRGYDPSGRRLVTFGDIYSSPNRLVNHEMRAGSVVCDRHSGLVVFASEGALGEVRAYTARGEAVWRLRFHGHRPTRIVDWRDGYSVQIPADGFHRLLSMSVIGERRLLVQVAFLTRSDVSQQRLFRHIDSFVIDVSTGELLHQYHDLPPVLATDGEVVAWGSEGALDAPVIGRAGVW